MSRQVHEALMWVFDAALDDDRLIDCTVAGVEPLPGGNRLLVKVNVPAHLPLADVAAQLTTVGGVLRMEVAQAITRRKTPELVFLPVPSS